MSHWRLAASFSRAKTREEADAQTIEGWNPWRSTADWLSAEAAIALPSPTDLGRKVHVDVYALPPGAPFRRFAQFSDGAHFHFYLPAPPDASDALAARAVRRAGQWRRRREDESPLPWPEPEPGWAGLLLFLEALGRVEAVAERFVYRGISLCRLCGNRNGHVAFQLEEWEWPEGYRHYLADHAVRPEPAFAVFVESIDRERTPPAASGAESGLDDA